MSIGIPAVGPQVSVLGELITDAVARGAVVYISIDAAAIAGNAVMQASSKAVAAMGDSATGRLAPPIPGGLQTEKTVIVTPSQPVSLTTYQKQLVRKL